MFGNVVELVDTLDLGSSALWHEGSSPSIPTSLEMWAGGGTGRRSGLKIRRHQACGFESRPAHQSQCLAPWWNWQTRQHEVLFPSGVQVQILPGSPLFLLLCARSSAG